MGSPDDTISVSDVAPKTATQQITGFIDDATTVPASLPEMREPADSIVAASMEVRTHSIIDVLSRPVIVADAIWDDGNAIDSTVASLVFPQALFDASTNMLDKLNFFTYFRADVCIRVVVNANTFQAGKLLGYFTPFEELIGNRSLATNFLSSQTAYPHVLLDASTGNVAELRIPYVSPYSSIRLTDNSGTIGNFNLKVLNKLRTGSCSVTIYAWFTNISVDLPSGRENSLTASAIAINNFKKTLKSGVPEKFIAQVAGEELRKSKVISGTLDKISTAASMFSGLPVVGSVAAPISWVSRFASNLAEYFGYAKSTNMATPCPMIQIPGKNFTSANGVDTSVILATSVENSIEPRNDIFGSAADDMDINYLCKHRCYVDSFTMDNTQTKDTLLYSFPVTPGWCKFDFGTFKPTITAYVASMFEYWRGGLRFKIQAAKTAYHSGRVRIVYLPAAKTADVDDSDQAYNWVLDLRNSSEIEFTIPYNNYIEWTRCRLVDSTVDVGQTSLGVIRIEVLNQLRAPDSVSPTIDFNVWLAGDSDLQFSIPSFQNYIPSLPDATNITIGEKSRRKPPLEEKFFAQVLGSQQDKGFNDMEDKPQLFSMRVPAAIEPCKDTIGEIITNLRYLCRRFSYYDVVPSSQETTINVEYPLYYFGALFDPTSSSQSTSRITPVDYISFLYRFFRGGMRYKFMKEATDLTGSLGYQEAMLLPGVNVGSIPAVVPDTIYNRFRDGSATFIHRVYSLINPILEVTTPFFSQTTIRPIIGNDQIQPKELYTNSLLYRTTSNNSTVEVLRATSDDFTFGWIVGPPRLRSRVNDVTEINFATTSSLVVSGTFDVTAIPVTINQFLSPGGYEVVSSVPATVDLTNTNLVTNTATPFILNISATGEASLKLTTALSANNLDLNQSILDLQAVGVLAVVLR